MVVVNSIPQAQRDRVVKSQQGTIMLSKLKCVALALSCLALTAPTFAADLPVKAKPILLAGYPYQGSGFYAGVGAVGAVLSADVGANSGGSNIFSAGAALDLTAGYQFTTGTNWYAFEVSAQYTNMGGSVTCGTTDCAVSSKWGFEQRALIGFPIQQVLAVLPNLSAAFPGLPPLPGGVNASTTNTHPYVFVGIREDDRSAMFALASKQIWTIQPVAGLGLRQQWTNGLVADTSVGCTFVDTGIQLGGIDNASAKFGRDCRAAFRLLY